MDIFEAEMARRFVVAVEKIANAHDRKAEPQTDCNGCIYLHCNGECGEVDDEPQTERSE